MVKGSEMPTEIWTTSAPGPPSTAPATQIEQATFELSWKTKVAVEKIPTKKKTASALWMPLPVLWFRLGQTDTDEIEPGR